MEKLKYNEINKELFEQINISDNEVIKEKIINNNEKLVHSIAKKYRWSNIEYEDLVQIGYLGLIKAINNFDINRGFEFSTYAVPMISGEIRLWIRDNTYLHISRSMKENIRKMNFTYNILLDKLKREPTDKEISNVMEVSEKELCEIKQVKSDITMKYLNEVLYVSKDGNDITLGDKLVDNKNNINQFIDSYYIKELMSVLNEIEIKIIRKRFFSDKTQTQVAKELNISQVQVSRFEKKALNKMRKVIYSCETEINNIAKKVS